MAKSKRPQPKKSKADKPAINRVLTDIDAARNALLSQPLTNAEIGTTPQKRQTVQEAVHAINSKFGRPVIMRGDDAPNASSIRRPCGIMPLDLDTGGGLPAGGMCVISGPENIGKTYLMYCYMMMHQRIYGQNSAIAYGYTENKFDYHAARAAGMLVAIPDQMIAFEEQARVKLGCPPLTDDDWRHRKLQTGEFFVYGGITGEDLLQATLELTRKNIFGLIGLDSLSQLLAQDEVKKDMDDPFNVRATAMLLTQFWYRLQMLLNSPELNMTTVIAIQQARDNNERANAPTFMQKYIPEWKVGGARAIRHGKLIDITVSPGEKIKQDLQGQKHTVGKYFRWLLTKAKMGAHDNASGEAFFRYPEYYQGGFGVDLADTVLRTGISRGILAESPKRDILLLRLNDRQYEPVASNVQEFLQRLRTDIEFDLRVRLTITYAAGYTNCLYRDAGP